MKNKITIILTSFLLIIVTSACAQQDSNKNTGFVNRSRNIDIKHIAIDLRFDWVKKQAYGTATITAYPLKSSNRIKLDAGMLSINAVTLSNGSPLKYSYDGGDKNDGLLIEMDRIYPAGKELTVKINYHTNYVNETDPNNLWGSYGKGLRFFSPTFTDPRKRKQIWSVGIPESNRYWFPCYDAPDDFRTTEFTATVDKQLTAISNGILTGVTEHTDGTHSYHWLMATPYANHQTSFVVGEYVDLKQNFNGIDIHNFSYPDEVEAVKASTARLTDMISFFSDKTSIKFPYPNYNQVFVQEFPWGGGHNMNTSTLSDNMVDDSGTHADFIYLWDWVEGNDLAAQWFGNMLTPKSWEHSWLNKSFAAYFSTLYNEYKNGVEDFEIYSRGTVDLPTIKGDWDAGIRRPVVTKKFDDPNTMLTDNYALSRGPQVLHMLRKYMGEANWWKTINIYLKTNAFKTVETKDFQNAVSRIAGKNMDWFFDQWVYKTGYPVFEVTKKYDKRSGLTLYVTQTQKPDSASLYPQVNFFQGKMHIKIDDKIEEIWIEPKLLNVFTFRTNEPKLVNFDFGNVWIKELKFEKTFDELLYQFQYDKDIMGRINAMNQLTAIVKTDSIQTDRKQKTIAALQHALSDEGYWRFKSLVLIKLRSMLKPPYDPTTISIIKNIIEKESSWLRSSAISFLGSTRDIQYEEVYIKYLSDKSDRVINTAASALANTKSPRAFSILKKLVDKPSWKNQSLMSALNAMKILKDTGAIEIALNALKDNPPKPRWTLANNSWDYRVVAAETLVLFGKGNEGFPIVMERFKKSMEENDVNDIFNNVMLITILGDTRGQEVFDLVKIKFKDDANAMTAVNQYEEQFKATIKK